ncbi:MAG TPA: non-ribosomal peptide synthetase, partial [Burkholderiales bacterium]|nr:non-ribosomal peptide synthetase [Burkholderiales bacterium]
VRSLATFGLGRGSRIGVALPNGPEMAVVLLAATDCATCAPLNPSSDETSSRHLLKTLRIDALIVPGGEVSPLLRVAESLAVRIVRLAFSPADPAGSFELSSPGSGAVARSLPPAPEDVVLVLHTSGTTALPKSAPLTCRNVVESALTMARYMQMSGADRCLCVAPLFAGMGIRRDLFPTLGAGGCVVCTAGFDPAAFVDWLDVFRPTFYSGSPAVQSTVLDLLERHGKPAHTLRFVISASAALPAELQRRLEAALVVPVIQAYAMSEAGSIAQEPLPPGQRRAGSVGLPAGCEVAILGDAGAFLPAHEVGEVVVRGGGVFAGYENDAEANRSAFHEGWFRTGDLGYIDEDGYLFLTGRSKEQINRGGFKVLPNEVDAALMRHPDVAEAACFATPHPTLGEDVVAAVVARNSSRVTERQLRDYAFEQLAAFKVPSRIVLVPELPKSALGKVKRAELAASLRDHLRREFSRPAGAHEELIAGFFADVLGVERIGAHDNFFELGGDSLRGAQLVTRVNAALALDLDPGSLFRRPTVAEFALELEATATERTVAPGPPPIVPQRRNPRAINDEPSS